MNDFGKIINVSVSHTKPAMSHRTTSIHISDYEPILVGRTILINRQRFIVILAKLRVWELNCSLYNRFRTELIALIYIYMITSNFKVSRMFIHNKLGFSLAKRSRRVIDGTTTTPCRWRIRHVLEGAISADQNRAAWEERHRLLPREVSKSDPWVVGVGKLVKTRSFEYQN